MRKRPLLLLACVFLAGLSYGRYDIFGLCFIPFWWILLEVYYGIKYKKIRIMAVRSGILLSVFLLGSFWIQQEESFRDRYLSKMVDGEEAVLWGEIKTIEQTDFGIRLLVSDVYISLNEEIVPCNDVQVYTSSTDFRVGEIHKISGKINMFEKPRNEGNFDSYGFYQSQKIDFALDMEDSKRLGFQQNFLRDSLLHLKEALLEVYKSVLLPKTAGFYAAMILGEKSVLEDALKELFTQGGIVHILAVSGLHMSIVGRGVYGVLRRLGVGFLGASIMGGGLLLGYCYMTGNGMSARRAMGMLFLFFLGQIWGKSYDMLNALGGVCLLLLWENPFLIEYSGFWFSVMALLGIGTLSKVFSYGEKRLSGLWSGIGITLFTLPVTAYCYYEIPMYSFLVNAVVLPVLTPFFAFAFLLGFVGLFYPSLASVLLVPCHWCLCFFEWVCKMVNGLPGAMVISGQPEWWQILMYYSLLLLAIYGMSCFHDRLIKRKGLWRLFKVGLCVLCIFIILFPKQQDSEVTFLDVGQGDGIYFCDGSGASFFVDGGSSSVDSVGKYRILPFLKSKGVSHIDYWFVSHADHDHISGLLEVFENGYEVRYLVVSKYAPREDALENLIHVAEEHGTEMVYMDTGDRIVSQGAKISCLYPWENEEMDKNEMSLTLWVEIRDTSILLAGDIGIDTEETLISKILEEECYPVDVYKVSHHGSKNSNSSEFLEVLNPKIAVISCSKHNLYGHPAPECVKRLEEIGSQVRYTMEEGQVTIK